MEKSSLDYREKLYSQIQEEYGKLVYTYTCHFKMADRLSKRNFWIKWGQIGLSAISTGGFLGVLISNEQILLWAGGLCSTALLALTSYLKDKDISTEKNDHIKTANKLWKVREKYLSLLTDFDEISIEEIVRKRDELLDESSEIYCAAPLTDGKSYAAAQAALKTNPKAEQDAMKNKNISSNGLLFDTCKHLRYVRDNYFRSYHLSGIVIDSFVYQAIGNWRWLSSGESSTSAAGTYEKILLDYYNQHFMWGAMPLSAPGSNQQVSTDNSRDCLGKVLRYIAG